MKRLKNLNAQVTVLEHPNVFCSWCGFAQQHSVAMEPARSGCLTICAYPTCKQPVMLTGPFFMERVENPDGRQKEHIATLRIALARAQAEQKASMQ